jgi:hypothetical protein
MELGVVPDARTPGVSLTEGPQMGFLDKAKAAATELAAKADEALSLVRYGRAGGRREAS